MEVKDALLKARRCAAQNGDKVVVESEDDDDMETSQGRARMVRCVWREPRAVKADLELFVPEGLLGWR